MVILPVVRPCSPLGAALALGTSVYAWRVNPHPGGAVCLCLPLHVPAGGSWAQDAFPAGPNKLGLPHTLLPFALP